MPFLKFGSLLEINAFLGVSTSSDLVAFLSGLLLGGDTKARNWFSSFVRIGQKVTVLMCTVCIPLLLFFVAVFISTKVI